MRLFTIIILFLVLMLHPTEVLALIDPARAAAIDVASELEKKSLDAQYKVQLLQSTGHIWTRQEVDAVTDFQKEFNDYVSTFNSLLTYAAEIYGIYYDVNSLANSLMWLGREIDYHPENAFAVALSTRKNNIYMKVMKSGVDVAMDIRQFLMSTKGKATTADENPRCYQAEAEESGQRDQDSLQVYPLYLRQRPLERDNRQALHTDFQKGRGHPMSSGLDEQCQECQEY